MPVKFRYPGPIRRPTCIWAFPTLVAMRTKQQVVKCCPPTGVGRAIF